MLKRVIAVVCLMCFGLLTSQAYAEHGRMKGGYGDMEEKVCRKAGWIIKNQEELGLSDEQVGKINDLNLATKKDMIKKKAEIEILSLDIKAGLREDEIDIAGLNALIDKKYEIKKEKTKSLVSAYAALKGILTEEQQKKIKELKGKCMMTEK